jgi:hypothetical protein
MAAGLGFKDFTTGEVLTAADVDGYLMQGVWVFASAAARDAAVTSPQEGNFAYLKDTNVTTYYTGSAWANLDTTGMTNPMTTTGDTIYSSSGSTPARLGIGTAGQVLTVNSGATAPEWAAPAGGGKILQVVQATYSTETVIASTTYTDTGLSASITPSSATSKVLVLVQQFNSRYRQSNGMGSGINLVRGSTTIYSSATKTTAGYIAIPGGQNEVNLMTMTPLNYLDTPSTTSSTTYKTQIAALVTSNSATATAQLDSNTSTMILMEVGA